MCQVPSALFQVSSAMFQFTSTTVEVIYATLLDISVMFHGNRDGQVQRSGVIQLIHPVIGDLQLVCPFALLPGLSRLDDMVGVDHAVITLHIPTTYHSTLLQIYLKI